MKAFLSLLLWAMLPVFAQQPPLYPPPPNQQGVPHRDYDLNRQHGYPRWCQSYDRRDYRRERRMCDDWRCRARVDRKAERCGLR